MAQHFRSGPDRKPLQALIERAAWELFSIAACGLSQGTPRLAFNTLRIETERSEQKGLINLFKGLFGTFRNVTAHAPRNSLQTWRPGSKHFPSNRPVASCGSS